MTTPPPPPISSLDAADVLKQESLEFMGHCFYISSNEQQRISERESSTVKLTNIPASFTEHDIESLLREFSGYHDIQAQIHLDRLQGFAIVNFADTRGIVPISGITHFLCLFFSVANLIQKHKKFEFRGSVIAVEASSEDLIGADPEVESNVISVSNISPDEDANSLKLLFENKRMSGGGAVERVEFVEEGFHVITFSSKQGNVSDASHGLIHPLTFASRCSRGE